MMYMVWVSLLCCCSTHHASHDIHFPATEPHQRTIISNFHEIAGFHNVLGCIDGMQIPILAPHTNENTFVCHKGYHSYQLPGNMWCKAAFSKCNWQNIRVVCTMRLSGEQFCVPPHGTVGHSSTGMAVRWQWLLGNTRVTMRIIVIVLVTIIIASIIVISSECYWYKYAELCSCH